MGGDAFGSVRCCAQHPARRDTQKILIFASRWLFLTLAMSCNGATLMDCLNASAHLHDYPF
jgi:hypothetical protein